MVEQVRELSRKLEEKETREGEEYKRQVKKEPQSGMSMDVLLERSSDVHEEQPGERDEKYKSEIHRLQSSLDDVTKFKLKAEAKNRELEKECEKLREAVPPTASVHPEANVSSLQREVTCSIDIHLYLSTQSDNVITINIYK